MPNNPDTAAQVARLREMAEEIRDSEARCLRFAAEADEDGNERSAGAYRLTASIQTNRLTALSAAADALEREAWCEEMGADVVYSDYEARWQVLWDSGDDIQQISAPTRNAAIDAARGAK
jgi:hypothetical protein